MATTFGNNKYEVMKYIKTVAVYLRKSRGDVDEDLKKHSNVIYEFINKHKWKYVEYKEIGTGSSISERTEIKYLLRDIKDGLFDAVVVFDYDRLGRGSATDQERIQNTLRMADTLVISLNPFEVYNMNSESDEEMIDFKGFLARREYKLITKRLQSGKKIGARMGNWVYSTAPFGYDYNPEIKGLIVNKYEKKILRNILSQYLNGASLNKIATQLNEKNIPSPRNKKWTGNTIKNILTNDVYMGKIISNKTSGVRPSKNPDGTKKPFKEHPKDEWIIVENCHESLLTEGEIMKVREILKSKTNHRNGNGKNSLSGLVQCGLCKQTMNIQRNGEYIGFKKCSHCNKNKGGEVYLVEDILKNRLGKLKDLLIQSKRKRNDAGGVKKVDEKIVELQREVNAHNAAIDRIKQGYEDGIYEDVNEMKERIKERRNKISDINNEISYLNKKKKELSNSNSDDKIKLIEKFYEELNSDNTPAEMNKIYKQIIRKIEWTRLDNENVNIKMYIK